MGGWHGAETHGGGGFRETRGETHQPTAMQVEYCEHRETHHREEGSRERTAPREREPAAFPTKPPYVAFVGNFPFEATQDEVLKACGATPEAVNVRAMTDRSQTKVRGYFVEFPDADSLREALKADGFVMGERPLRVNVADERKSMDRGRRSSTDRGQRRNSHREDQWTSVGNAAPVPKIVEPAAERPKLVLKPRSVERDSGEPPIAVGSASIFGGAKPVDTSKILAEVEKKIDAELHREPAKLPTPKHEKKVHTPVLKIQEEVVTRVENTNVFSLLSIEDDE